MVKLFDRLTHHPNGRNGHGDVPLDEALADHRLACISRAIDDREIALRQQSQVFFQISGAGHEALLLGLTRSLRAGYDWFFPYYRDRALVLGLGVTPLEILLQAVGSADDPASGGRQMPCHWGDAARHIVSQSSPTGSQCLPAIGCAEAGRYIVGRDLPGCSAYGDEVTYVSLGEGACSEGEFWESLNTACRLGLPVLYVVADNGYAISVRASDQAPAPVWEMVMGIRGLHVARVDGCDYFDVRRKGAEAVQRVRAGQGPGLLHATVTRPYSHSLSDDQKKYPTEDEPVTFGEAIRLTLHEQMARDERIRVFGEDVADADPAVLGTVPGKGGVFGITHGLQTEFGIARCYNTPLAEANIVGRAIGQGTRGLRPSPEVQFFDYIWPAMQQIKSEAATLRWRSNGEFSCPMVLRVPIGGYLTGGSIWHSQCGESIFAHVPGLLVAFPSRARDAAGLLRTAFRYEDPVLFLEHKHLYRQGYNRDPLPPPDWLLPFGKGAYVTRGERVTVVTYGATVHRAELAAREIDPDGGAVEIVDLRTLVPWDQDIVGESVAKTGRVLVLFEDTLRCGVGAEVAAWIADECFEDLDAPGWRLAALDTPVPYEPTLEQAVLPQVDDIARDLRALLAY